MCGTDHVASVPDVVSFPDPPTKNGGRVWEMGLYVRVAEEFVPRNYMQPQSGRVKTAWTADGGCQHHILCRCCGNSVSDSRKRRRLSSAADQAVLPISGNGAKHKDLP